MQAELICFEPSCRATYPILDEIYTCPACRGLLEVAYQGNWPHADRLKELWRERRKSNAPLDTSGVWRYREVLPFEGETRHAVTLREGDTALLDAPASARFAGLDRLRFKHQGYNPTGSFKDNGMTCGATQAVRLGKTRVACVSTGNTSASMAAYAAAAGLEAIIFLPHGNISFGKLSQAIEYGARTLQVEANFDQILALVRSLASRLGIYLLNSINPFRIEGQKTIMVELMDQLDWIPPDWVVLPGGNLGNVSAFGKAFREMAEIGLIKKIPRLAIVQAEGASPFYEYWQKGGEFRSVEHPATLATAIKIGDPVSWPKAAREIHESRGAVEKASEQEIADAKAVIGRCGIGCEPASAATLAGLKKMRSNGLVANDDDVVAVLTGNVLKDPDYIYGYHTGTLKSPDGNLIQPNWANPPEVTPNDAEHIVRLLER